MDQEEMKATVLPLGADVNDTVRAAVLLETQLRLDRGIHERQHRHIPFAISYFTKKAEEEKIQREIEARKLSLENMSIAHLHFQKMETQLRLDRGIHEQQHRHIPFAISYFTKKAEEEKVQREIEARKLSLENMSIAHMHFYQKNQELKAERKASSGQQPLTFGARRPVAINSFAANTERKSHATENEKVQGDETWDDESL